MSNPYRPVYTPHQTKLVDAGRAALLERWRTSTALVRAQPSDFTITFVHTVVDGSELVDVFDARCVSAEFAPEWQREIARNAAHFSVEHGRRCFTVLVKHSYYLAAPWLPVSVDASCVIDLIKLAMLAALLAIMAAFVLGY